jgi:hypothetical protein
VDTKFVPVLLAPRVEIVQRTLQNHRPQPQRC